MGLRDRREDRQAGRRGTAGGGVQPDAGQAHLRRGGYWIETSSGRRAFKADGKALRVRDTFTIKDTEGQVVAQM